MAPSTTPPRETRGNHPPHPLPALSELSERQVRGAACVYCGVDLDSADAVDLGERHTGRAGRQVRWFPRACPQHGRTQ